MDNLPNEPAPEKLLKIERDKESERSKKLIEVVFGAIILILSGVWFAMDGGFEPLIGAIVAIGGLIAVFSTINFRDAVIVCIVAAVFGTIGLGLVYSQRQSSAGSGNTPALQTTTQSPSGVAGDPKSTEAPLISTPTINSAATTVPVTEPTQLPITSNSIKTAAISPDGNLVVTLDQTKVGYIWDAKKGVKIGILEGHSKALKNVVFSSDGKQIITISEDETARVWNADIEKPENIGKPIAKFSRHTDAPSGVMFHPDGTIAVSWVGDGRVRVWDVNSGKERYIVGGEPHDTESPTYASFSPDGNLLVTGDIYGRINLLSADDGTVIRDDITGNDALAKIRSITFSNDGKYMAATSSNGHVRIWPMESDTPGLPEDLETTSKTASYGFFSPDSSSFVVSNLSDDQPSPDTSNIFNIKSGSVVTVTGHLTRLRNNVFSQDGKLVITSSGNEVTVYHTDTGAVAKVLTDHTNQVSSAEFSADGRFIVTSGSDGAAFVYETSEYKKVTELRP